MDRCEVGGRGVVGTPGVWSWRAFGLLAALVAVGCLVAGCLGPRRGAETARSAEDLVIRDIDPIFRGLIGTEATVRGASLRLLTGIGLVVGLQGTGSGDVPSGVRFQLEERMIRLGVGRADGGALSEISPAQLIDSPDTAVVLVQAVIRPSLPEGSRFDVRVSAWPGSATTSLEGGRLYTTELRAARRGSDQRDVPRIADARGEIFINPFTEDDSLTPPTAGRVLSGGRIVNRTPLQLLLDNPSHARAREIVQAINSRFPSAGGPRTAQGRNDEVIELNVPPRFEDDIDSFLRLVRFTRVDRSSRLEWARRYAEAMVERPRFAEDLGWALRAIGPAAIPFVRPLYDHPDVAPRLAAIQTGAFLGDPTVRPAIESLVESGPVAFRVDAMGLLADLPVDPRVNSFLREQLSSEDPALRVAAYEAMLELEDPLILKPSVSDDFAVHVVPSDVPTVYVTQQDEAKIVIFGQEMEVAPAAFTSVWDGDFLLTASSTGGRVEMLYDQPDIGRLVRVETEPSVVRVVGALSRRPTYDSLELGFDMSYSRAVRVLAEMVDSEALRASFFPEEDRLRLALLRARDRAPTRRPGLIGETAEDRAALDEPPSEAELAAQAERAEQETRELRERIIRFSNPDDEPESGGGGG